MAHALRHCVEDRTGRRVGGLWAAWADSAAEVKKSVVQARLIDAGLKDAAYYAGLTVNSAHFARWFAPDHLGTYADDPDWGCWRR